VTFALTRRGSSPALARTNPTHEGRMPNRAPEAGEQYRFHVDMGKCIGCKCCVVACNEQNGNPATINWRRVQEIEGGYFPTTMRSSLSMGCNHCLEPTCVLERSRHRHRAPQRRRLHRLPILHVELFVRCPSVQPRARRGQQMRHVPRALVDRSDPGLCERMPGRRNRDRDRERRHMARGRRQESVERRPPER